MSLPRRLSALMTMAAAVAGAHAGPLQSVGPMTFVDGDTLLVSDWRGAQLVALTLPKAQPAPATPFNLKAVATPIAKALHVRPDQLQVEDMKIRPGTGVAYIGLSVQRRQAVPAPALVAVDTTGRVSVVDLGGVRRTTAALDNPPAADKRLWRDVPQATLTVTDLTFHQGKVYVAGLSNASFASTLRILDYPFTGKTRTTSVEMYHAVHDQVETRAPIRKLAVVGLAGRPTLLAAYTCTPLVTIPLAALVDGAHVTGKTIAELGWGSSPVDLVTFDAGQGPMVLLANSHKSADLMSLASIAEGDAQPGLAKPIVWPTAPLLGVRSTSIPLAGLEQLADQDADHLAVLRRHAGSGALELVSVRKGAFLRLSDFVNEYDFPDYRYGAASDWRGFHRTLRTDEGYADLVPRE